MTLSSRTIPEKDKPAIVSLSIIHHILKHLAWDWMKTIVLIDNLEQALDITSQSNRWTMICKSRVLAILTVDSLLTGARSKSSDTTQHKIQWKCHGKCLKIHGNMCCCKTKEPSLSFGQFMRQMRNFKLSQTVTKTFWKATLLSCQHCRWEGPHSHNTSFTLQVGTIALVPSFRIRWLEPCKRVL